MIIQRSIRTSATIAAALVLYALAAPPVPVPTTGAAESTNITVDTRDWILTTRVLGNGTISGVVADGVYLSNTYATFTASPAIGYVFTGWSGDSTGITNQISVVMDANKTITANFTPDESDVDGDGLSAYLEVLIYGTNPLLADTDGDGLTDGWEVGRGRFSIITGSFTWAQARADAHARGGELACLPTQARWNRAMETLGAKALDPYTGLWIGATDATTEGTWTWVNGEPFTFSQWAAGRPITTTDNGSDYAEVSGGDGWEIGKWYDRNATTIRDGYILETGYATDPLVADADGDGLNDGAELAAGSNPFMPDTDSDGLTDKQEVSLTHTNPNLADSNGNGINDAAEDTDADGFDNLFEVNAGFNPVLASSTPEAITSIRTTRASTPATVEFRFNAASGVSYQLESSTDLSQWDIIEPVIIGLGASVTRTYPIDNQPSRFFRVKRN